MSDRELLELAAKASGYDLTRMCDPVESGEPYNEFFHLNGKYWNPLMADGDALRLAVKLSLSVFTGGVGCASVTGWIVHDENAEVINVTELFGVGDAVAATRRAIVRCAADIGRRMP